MADLSPVETLREAAALLRVLGADASRGPWIASPDDGLVWADRIGDPVSGSTEVDDAKWIALVHPGIAAPLADWLETYARRYVHWQDARRSPDFAHPYAVARVVLGVPDDAA